MTFSPLGPDLVIAGAARSGTSALAARLSSHPDIDPGSVKESNYFSRGLDRGPAWYDSLYGQRRDGLLRLDGSTSYTSALYPDALVRLAEAAPAAFVVYLVRQPTERALSHYLFRHHYFRLEAAPDFGAALRSTSYYVGGSDYSRWLPELRARFGAERLLVVPFELVTHSPDEATAEVCRLAGLAPPPGAEARGKRHRNSVVEYRSDAARRAAAVLRRSSVYPRLRSALGAGRVRQLRALVTRQARLPTTEEAMTSCTPDQLAELHRLDERAGAAVREHLEGQDARLGLVWAPHSFAGVST